MSKRASFAASVLLVLTSFAAAQYYLPWSSVNSGGGIRTGTGATRVSSSVAQAVQGAGTSSIYYGWWGFWLGDVRRDVGVSAILAPINQVDTLPLTPRATVRNYGQLPEPSITVFCRILYGGVPVYSGTATVSDLGPSGTSTATFPVYGGHHALGDYVMRCSTDLDGDANRSNDLATGTFSVVFNPPSASGAWIRQADLPAGGKGKNVKDGGALAYGLENANDTGYIYAFKGNNRFEFYRYNTTANVWLSRESIPALNRNSKKKAVKKGSSLVMGTDGKVYATKGNGLLDFWRFDPAQSAGRRWTQLADVPAGAKPCKEGTGTVAVRSGGIDYIYLLKGSGTQEFYRYNVSTGVWDTSLPTAPGGASGKPYTNGSALAGDGNDTIYALKGSYNEFAAYSISGKTWQTRDPLPLVGGSGTKKSKVKDGAGIAYSSRVVYALKGGNTNEFWYYKCDTHRWYTAAPLTTGLKKVKGGGALVYGKEPRALYAFRGNNTREFWMYSPVSLRMFGAEPKNEVMAGAMPLSAYHLSAEPNPFAGMTRISYALPKAGNVSLKLYDVTGKLVTTLAQV